MVVPFLVVADPADFVAGEVRVTVETDVADSVLVASVSAGAAASVPVEEGFAVSAPDPSERAQPAANTPATRTPASDDRFIDAFPEPSEAPWAGAASLSPTLR